LFIGGSSGQESKLYLQTGDWDLQNVSDTALEFGIKDHTITGLIL